jgi:hypothetical protein
VFPFSAVLPHCAALNNFFSGISALKQLFSPSATFNAEKQIFNQQPVAQTCGRSNSFGLACTLTSTELWGLKATSQDRALMLQHLLKFLKKF